MITTDTLLCALVKIERRHPGVLGSLMRAQPPERPRSPERAVLVRYIPMRRRGRSCPQCYDAGMVAVLNGVSFRTRCSRCGLL